MAHLDVAPLELASIPIQHVNAPSPDDISMFGVFDGDGDPGFLDSVKQEGLQYDRVIDDSNATFHTPEVLVSLDNSASSVHLVDQHHSPDPASGSVSGSSHDDKPRVGPKTKMTAEEKKRRNRDCMRRLRNRRNDLIATMQTEIQALESQLNRQMVIAQGDDPEPPSESCPKAHPGRRQEALQKLQIDHAQMKSAMRRLREENYWLQKQIAQRQASLDAVQQLADTHSDTCPPIDLDALDKDDIGVWIRNTHHFFQPLEASCAFEIVLESYRIIQDGIGITKKIASRPNAVLGWSDQRSVDHHWASFLMQKSFPHEPPRPLALKTWHLLSHVAEINVLQPKSHEMKVLQRLNEYTLVIARHTYFADTQFSYCMIYLLFLLETDTGFVIGSRSLEPDADRMHAFMADRMVVAKPFHCFHFEPDGEGTGEGCKLTFAGRVDNVVAGCAQSCAMDMLLAMMRWESHCVSPLWRLTA